MSNKAEAATYPMRLRALADFFDAHPELPNPGVPTLVYTDLAGIARAARVAAMIPGSRKAYDDKWAIVYIPVPDAEGQDTIQFYTSRHAVCKAVETEAVEVPARTEVIVTKWECQPLLGLDVAMSGVPAENALSDDDTPV